MHLAAPSAQIPKKDSQVDGKRGRPSPRLGELGGSSSLGDQRVMPLNVVFATTPFATPSSSSSSIGAIPPISPAVTASATSRRYIVTPTPPASSPSAASTSASPWSASSSASTKSPSRPTRSSAPPAPSPASTIPANGSTLPPASSSLTSMPRRSETPLPIFPTEASETEGSRVSALQSPLLSSPFF